MNTPRQHGIGDVKMRLIDADALKAKIRKAEKEFRRCKIEPFERKMAFADGVGAVADLIVDEAPTIEERQHGHWIEHPTLFGTWVCSECGMTIYNFYKADKLYIYCPKCGAKMDGENNG